MTLRELNKILAPAFMNIRIVDAGLSNIYQKIVSQLKETGNIIKEDNQSITVSRFTAITCDELMNAEIYQICPNIDSADDSIILQYK